MEALFIAIIGAVVEILLEIVAYAPWDLWLWSIQRRRKTPDSPWEIPLTGIAFNGALIGLAVGGLSLVVHKQTMLPWPWLRILNVVVAPFVSGTLARFIAIRRNRGGATASPRQHFCFAFTLTLALAVVRFVYSVRPKY